MKPENTEKTWLLSSGRSVKITTPLNTSSKTYAEDISFDVTIKDALETHYHPPIEESHPRYWKLQRIGPAQQPILQLQYSGLSKRQIKDAISSLKHAALQE